MKQITQNLRCLLLCLMAGMGSVVWAQDVNWNAEKNGNFSQAQTVGEVTLDNSNSTKVVFAKASGSASPAYYNSDSKRIVMVTGNTLTISSSRIIKEISFTNDASNLSVKETRISNYKSSQSKWTGLSNTVTFNCDGTVKIKTITITYYATDATEIQPITVIPNVATLIKFCDQVNGGVDYSVVPQVKLTADLDMSGEIWTEPIGSSINPFRGNFVGAIYKETYTNENEDETYRYKTRTISNLSGTAGLFGYVENARIAQVSLTGVNINSSDGTDTKVHNTGGLVNYSTGHTIISECSVTGSVLGDDGTGDNVGGIVGYALGDIEISSCDVTLSMNGMYNVGGIVGYLNNTSSSAATITDCSSTNPSDTNSEILARASVGGIVGKAEGQVLISKCFNKSQINSTASYASSTNDRSYIGGIVGYASSSVSIERCYNKGGLTMNAPGEGGIVGYTEGSVSYCYNTGSLGGHDCIGGIIGIANGATVTNSYNNAKVTGNGTSSRYLGSIVGYADADATYGGHGITASNNYYEIPDGSGATDGCGGTSVDESGMTKKATDGLKGWVLEGNEFLGDGTSTGDSRRWVFVRENDPLLYDVRGQEIKLQGNNGRNITDKDNQKSFATFSSDVAFTCDDAYWAERIAPYTDGSKIFVFQQTSILYPSVGDGYQKGYMLKAAPGHTFKLVYRPEAEMLRVVNKYVTYSQKDYITDDLDDKEDNSQAVICANNFMYGVGKQTSYNNLYKENGTIFYLSGNKEGSYTYAVFKKLTPNNSSSIGDNKTYLLVNPNELSVEGSAKTMFNISFNEFVEPATPVLLGDVDVDGAVTITDVVKMVNVVLNETADEVIMKHGDVNGDGELDVADVVATVNKVLGVENDVKARKVSSASNGGDEASLELNDGVVDFLLNNSSAFCAFQFYMNAEDGLDCESIILSARAKGHFLSMNQLSDGRYKVMCYSGANNTFAGSDGELFNILTSGASGKLTLEDLFFVTPGASKVKFGNLDIDVVPTGISGIDADANANANTIFDLSGRRVQKAQKGVYIVNGKKVIL